MELQQPIPGLLARDHPASHAFPVRRRTSGTLQLASPLQSRGGRSLTLLSPVLGQRGPLKPLCQYRSLPVVAISLFLEISPPPHLDCRQSPNC